MAREGETSRKRRPGAARPSARARAKPPVAEGIVTLRSGRASLAVAPAVGGSIVRYWWEVDGASIDWLRPTTPFDVAAGRSGGMGCFPLVPFSNRIRKGRFAFRGHKIRLPRNQPPSPHSEHGHGWMAPWSPVAQSRNRLAIEYRHPAGAWPFAYRARQTFRLSSRALVVEIAVVNLSRQPMPVGIGLHPYFPRTPRTTLTARIDQMWRTDDEIMPVALVDPPPRLALDRGLRVTGSKLDNAYTGWRKRARISWPERRANLVISAEGPLSFLVVYAPTGKRYFCAEPVSNCTDAFNLATAGRNDTGMIVLAPGAKVSARVTFRPTLDRAHRR
ncbi:MAG: aldose 1-epimerase [Rhodospirillales bacterium]|nr:aldose 1-epimerase [Rhodospirillales bacterium]